MLSFRSGGVRLLMVVVVVVLIFFVAVGDAKADKNLLLIQPICFMLLHLIFPSMLRLAMQYIGMAVLNGVLFFKYVIVPFLVFGSTNVQNYLIAVPSSSAFNFSIGLMVWEMVAIFSTVWFFSRVFYSSNLVKKDSGIVYYNSTVVLICFSLIGMAVLVVIPGMADRYNFFWSPQAFEVERTDIPLRGLFSIITDLVLIVIPCLFLNYFRKKYDKNKKVRWYIFSLFALLPFVLIFKGSSRFSVLVPTLAWLIVMIRLFPQYKKPTAGWLTVLMVTVFVVITMLKQFGLGSDRYVDSSLEFGWDWLAYNGNAYFSGVYNVANSLEAYWFFENKFGISSFFSDNLNNLAVLSSLADSSNTSAAWFNYYMYGVTGKVDQIVPMLSQGYFYFGLIGAPIYLCLSTFLVMFFDRKVVMERRVEFIYIYVYMVVYLAMSPMLSINSAYPLFFNLLLPLVCVFWLNRKLTLTSGSF